MEVDTKRHGDLSCEISQANPNDEHTGALRYKTFEVGTLTGSTPEAITSQFEAICDLVDTGAMVRHGLIMTGHHNRDFKGDVLLLDGEFLGTWYSDDEEWCHFTADGETEVTCCAPSPWKLLDALSDWVRGIPGPD